ncbi:hypothetical protein FH593_21185 (plasmid) [Leptospira interrogans]|uniref:Uncharacterized protein n=1 Tax=Leptospira interrogans str. UI 12758 TaxID=1049938 RepID=A0A0E2D8L7_LEPIR|nr:hypothetical protein [Leptospira interrogans]EMN33305.1 hypothetical protein LEP1GSC084_0039 [Leptospira interrogans serovar Medanensis str. L0448]EKR56204.1 hypothetical protein LEP1GSC105_0032 [Leptospira interrogans str. UI 12758]EMN94096.1 hypothetical protein LEP1GSC110_0021 [Leptospira interrogans serovar Medanensis str. UT053]ULG90748.1 hypothetical protein FH593_21185 [Leptospira interrogans]UML74697.1 hypothetical protein FH583_02270 [Leptospira interrogans]
MPKIRKKTKKEPTKKRSGVKKNVILSDIELERLRMEYLQGIRREKICKNYGLTYKQLDNIIEYNSWNLEKKEISGNLKVATDLQILTNLADAIAKINLEATKYLEIYNERMINPKTTNLELSILTKSRYTHIKELLRSLSVPDTIRTEQNHSEEKNQVIIQIVTGVGETPGTSEKLLEQDRVGVKETTTRN